jgi:transcriptional regulator with XRE-family HTH domain
MFSAMPGFDSPSLLRTKRQALGLTQNQLAWASGVSPITVSRIERGAHLPNKRTARALASVLNVNPDHLRIRENKDRDAEHFAGVGAPDPT